MTSLEEFLKKIIAAFGDVGREAFYSIIDKEVNDALTIERKRDVKRATRALYEGKVKEDVIVQLLHDYWGIDKNQAMNALRVEKTVKNPKKVLITYLQGQGYKPSDIKEFMVNNNVEKQLENNPSLWTLSNTPAKLMKAVEENNDHID